jgi:hypothetical integral membrane protein (TIGR02206 family)
MAQFSAPHLAALAVWLLVTVVSVTAARHSDANSRWITVFRWGLAVTIIGFWAGEYIDDALRGIYTAQFTLPLQLTDIISLTAAYALITRKQLAVELVYLWAFTATLQATVTPDLFYNFPSFYYFTYFGYHIGALVAAAFLVWGLRIPLRRGAWLRVFAATLVWSAIAGTADIITGGNYMYLAWKPTHTTLLSVMGPWPWYIASGVGVAFVLLGAVQLITGLFWRPAVRQR